MCNLTSRTAFPAAESILVIGSNGRTGMSLFSPPWSDPDRDGFLLDDFLAMPDGGSRGSGTVGGGPGGGEFIVLKLNFRGGADNGRLGCPGDREVSVLRLAFRGGLSGGGLNDDELSGGALKGGDIGSERGETAAGEPSARGGLCGREAGVVISDGRA